MSDNTMRKAMIVWGGWPGHDPDLCASMIRDDWVKLLPGDEVAAEVATAVLAAEEVVLERDVPFLRRGEAGKSCEIEFLDGLLRGELALREARRAQRTTERDAPDPSFAPLLNGQRVVMGLAMAVAFVGLLIWWIMGWGAQAAEGWQRALLTYLAPPTHVEGAVRGLIVTGDIVYFASAIVPCSISCSRT